MEYTRCFKNRLLLYQASIITLVIILVWIILKSSFEYLPFLIILYLLRDWVFRCDTVSVKLNLLKVEHLLLGGILKRRQIIQLNSIIDIYSIGTNAGDSDTGWETEDFTSLLSSPSSIKGGKFDVYQINYLDNNQQRRYLKVRLYLHEYRLLLRKNTASNNSFIQ